MSVCVSVPVGMCGGKVGGWVSGCVHLSAFVWMWMWMSIVHLGVDVHVLVCPYLNMQIFVEPLTGKAKISAHIMVCVCGVCAWCVCVYYHGRCDGW